MGIPECFPTLNETGKQPVPNAGTKSGPGRGCSRMLGTGNFPNFFGKYPVPGKWHSGTQTSICRCWTSATGTTTSTKSDPLSSNGFSPHSQIHFCRTCILLRTCTSEGLSLNQVSIRAEIHQALLSKLPLLAYLNMHCYGVTNVEHAVSELGSKLIPSLP